MTKRHILVTGGAGYIGSHMTLALLGAGERPLVIDNLSTGSRAIVPPEVPFFEGNVGDADFVGRIMDEHPIEAIIHFAASIVVPESVTQPLAYYGNNTANARTLLDCAVKRACRMWCSLRPQRSMASRTVHRSKRMTRPVRSTLTAAPN